MGIDYENDLLKHFVRTNGWLPVCERRLKAIRQKQDRRLRYFTFCAVQAIDVLMLDVAKVIRRSETKRFDTVFFFDKDESSVFETRKRIPGAIGFPGNFVEVVLLDEPDDAALIEDYEPLNAPENEEDDASVNAALLARDQRAKFIKSFPFDVVNLDLEQFLFRPKEDLPGKLLRAMRKIFQWQQQHLIHNNQKGPIDGFSLMFTTQIGPPDIASDYLDMLEKSLRDNLQNDLDLEPLLNGRAGTNDVAMLRGQQFELFFKLAMPKAIAGILLENDWYIEPGAGILIFQFQRSSVDGPYQMLHLVMDVKRQEPPKDKRPPTGAHAPAHTEQAINAYRDVTRKLFREPETIVAEHNLDAAALKAELDIIQRRRRKYYPDDPVE